MLIGRNITFMLLAQPIGLEPFSRKSQVLSFKVE